MLPGPSCGRHADPNYFAFSASATSSSIFLAVLTKVVNRPLVTVLKQLVYILLVTSARTRTNSADAFKVARFLAFELSRNFLAA